MQFNAYFLIPVISLFGYFFVAVYVIAVRRRHPANRNFFLFVFSLTLWSAGKALLCFELPEVIIVPVLKVVSIFWLPNVFLFFNFVYTLLDKKRGKLFYTFFVITIISIIISLFTNYAIKGYIEYDWGYHIIQGFLFKPLVFINAAIPSIFITIWLFQARYNAENKLHKKQLNIVLVGTVASVIIGQLVDIISALILGVDDFIRLAFIAQLILVYSVFVAIVKYDFMSLTVTDVAEKLFANLKDGVILLDMDNNIIRFNTEAQRLFKGHLKKMTSFGEMNSLLNYNIEAEYRNHEAEIVYEEGNIPVVISQARVTDNNIEPGTLIILTDNSENRLIENIRENVDRMIQHDMKTPISAIVGFADLVELGGNSEEELNDFARQIKKSAHNLNHTIESRLDLVKLETGSYQIRPHEFNINSMINDILNELKQTTYSKKVTTEFKDENRTGSNENMIYAEAKYIRMMLQNLIKNAIEASPENSTIEIVYQRKEMHTLTIKNQGNVPESIRKRFFERYVTMGKQKGTGLGTYTARLIASAHEGSISMQTGSGSTMIIITLPIRLQL